MSGATKNTILEKTKSLCEKRNFLANKSQKSIEEKIELTEL